MLTPMKHSPIIAGVPNVKVKPLSVAFIPSKIYLESTAPGTKQTMYIARKIFVDNLISLLCRKNKNVFKIF